MINQNQITKPMTDAEVGRRFRKLIKAQGAGPKFHNDVINSLKYRWPLLHTLIKEAMK